MPWIYALIGLFAGIIIGVVISRITTPQYQKQKEVQKELEASKFELEQQRQDLNDYFSESAKMLDNLSKEYRKLYEHMANSSNELLPNMPDQDNPFIDTIKRAANEVESSSSDSAPRDYANGPTGMLKEKDKVVLKAPEAIQA
jgi:uncharacterized membrane-anchored protein YhcB (DUF1043 family)